MHGFVTNDSEPVLQQFVRAFWAVRALAWSGVCRPIGALKAMPFAAGVRCEAKAGASV